MGSTRAPEHQSTRGRMDLDNLPGQVVDSAIEVHATLGPGLLEEVYKQCLKAELLNRELKVLVEVGLPVFYKGVSIAVGYRIDLLVEDAIIVELKTVHHLAPIHRAQVYTYMTLADKPLGLLLNFNSKLMKDGIARVHL